MFIRCSFDFHGIFHEMSAQEAFACFSNIYIYINSSLSQSNLALGLFGAHLPKQRQDAGSTEANARITEINY